MHHDIGICVIAQSPAVSQGIQDVIDRLSTALIQDEWPLDPWQPDANVSHCVLLAHMLKQACDYLVSHQKKQQFTFTVLTFTSLDEARAALQPESADSIDLVIADIALMEGKSVEQNISSCFYDLHALSAGRLSPYSFVLLLPPSAVGIEARSELGQVNLSVQQKDPVIWEMQVLKNVMDHLDSIYINKLLARTLTSKPVISTPAQYIYRYMDHHFHNRWDFHYYIGSMISGFIDSMFRLCQHSNVQCESGANEHSLAVSALCGWQLYQRGYVVAITSGMIDEFRGTLYNLKRAHAPGIIICADSAESNWFPFQGTMHTDYDGRKAIEAKGIPYVYLDDKLTLVDKLPEIVRIMQDQPGPVFVFATQQALETTLQIGLDSDGIEPITTQEKATPSSELSAVMELINNSHRRIVWQCSHLDNQERELVYQIAERAGIALVDTMISPGSVSDYRGREPVENYIGTLSVYGFNRKVFQYLHQDQQLAEPDTQSVFFLKSKVDQASSPLSPGKLKNKCHIVQVNYKPHHISPFTDLAVTSRLLPFLQSVSELLDVTPEVLAYRRAELKRVHASPETMPVDWLPQQPMSPNYFYAHLSELLHDRIQHHDYQYIGVYDVGRCGVSAIRNLPKTGLGFSGWYGRALMGDALMALPYLARTASQNILAFVGDGARDLVPNIERQIEQAFLHNPHRDKINITVFYLCNGVLSMIQSYIDKRSATNNIKQVALLSRDEKQKGATSSPTAASSPNLSPSLLVNKDRWSVFDANRCLQLLDTPKKINFIDVVLSHNSDGDGLSLLSETAWHRINVA
ncbi:hypothetical protein [Photobacterium nomapromontoriensis]|uniref:hypothetical protein n=1 Tax=Photobacterium nomapromontoriensis TaxID=2910237 RepID=UPI003D14A708